MTYTKPKNMKYTDMCIYFDNNFHVNPEDRDDALLYQYMYHIIYMLACKQRYFLNYYDYDEFAIFAANMLYVRFDKFDREGKPIKSILNYIKASLYALKATYISKTKTQNLSISNGFDADSFTNNLKSMHQHNYSKTKGLSKAIIESIEELPFITYKIVLKTPYRNNLIMIKRLYQSCILTLLNEFTPSNFLRDKIDRRNERSIEDMTIDNEMKLLHREHVNVVLWKLSREFEDYVLVLTRKIKKELSNELIATENEYRLDDNILDCLLKNFQDCYDSDRE